MFTVQYRCAYREYWYDLEGGDTQDWPTAVSWCVALKLNTGRFCRVVDGAGNVLYQC